jgi:peroxiredoxin
VLNEEDGSLPHPTVVVIGRDGRVRYRWTDPNYRVRPTPDQLLEALDED